MIYKQMDKDIRQQSLLSILIPCYNAEKYVAETLECLLGQDYENIEIILVDDGSSDNSYDIAKQFETDPRVQVFQQPNSGACVARNLALSKAKGEYVMFMDADDLVTKDMIASQMVLLEDAPEGYMTFGRWARFYDGLLEHAKIEDGEIYHDYDKASDALADLWNGKGMMPIHTYIIPKSVVGEERYDVRLKVNQDGEFLCRMLMRAKGLKYCPQGVAYYRSGIAGSVSAKKISHAKGESLLLASQLCKTSIGDLANDKYFARGLGRQFYGVAYIYQSFPDIVEAAHNELNSLNIKLRNPGIGSKNFQRLCSLFGFWNMLKLKQSLKR